jgi:pimeloyl-ACP methyl ester carboxylesterase/class 3 adenylate cyclase
MQPETHYAKSGGVNIAYQVVGTGSVDLVFVPGWVSHVEYAWEEPSLAPFLRRLARFARLIQLDRRGTGLSDPVDRLPTLEERMDDVRAVMDAAGSQRAFLFGISEGGPMCVLLAATYPERTAGLILCNTFARSLYADDHPWSPKAEQWQDATSLMEARWGRGVSAWFFAPSRAADQTYRRAWGRFERRSVSPGAMRKILSMAMDTDVRDVLPSIRVPTLVVHRIGDIPIRVESGRYLARHIPGARLVEVDGIDHFPWIGDSGAILDAVERFILGAPRGAEPDRVLATVLFTDIVGSTARAAELGDRRWRDLLEGHHALVRTELDRFRGREIVTAGDGFLATFDGPARGIRCAHAIVTAVGQLGIAIRAGLHTGECEVMGDTIGGIAVHIGARVAAAAGANEVLVSSTVKDLVAGSGIAFTDRGARVLKGVPGEWRLFAADV